MRWIREVGNGYKRVTIRKKVLIQRPSASAERSLELIVIKIDTRYGESWQASCSKAGHNMVSRGERELRGERHGKGGRSLRATAVSSFLFLPSLLLPLAALPCHPGMAAGQALQGEVRVGLARSTRLVSDAVTGPILQTELRERLQAPVSARLSTGLQVTGVVRTRLRPDLDLEVSGGWSRAQLEARDAGGNWPLQSVSLLQGVLGVRLVRDWGGYVSAGVGALQYLSPARSIFREGTGGLRPLLVVGLGAMHRLAGIPFDISLEGQGHRFTTPAITQAGGSEGSVMRLLLQLGVQLGPGRRP